MADAMGQFVWYELMTTDADAAEEFYRSVIGWGVQDASRPEFRYTLLTAGEIPVGGVMDLPDAAREMGAGPGWIGYIAVDDVDGRAAMLAKAGGKIHRSPEDIPEVGRFAVVADPQGAVFVLFKSLLNQPVPSAPLGTPGHGGWRELHAADWESAFAFYSGLFGWNKGEAMDMGPMGVYQLFARGAEPIGGMMTKQDASSPSPSGCFTSMSRAPRRRRAVWRSPAAEFSMDQWRCRAACDPPLYRSSRCHVRLGRRPPLRLRAGGSVRRVARGSYRRRIDRGN